ncbi:MAG: hypothetical protein ACT4OK_15230 [Gemmobacter sp.]
MAKDESASGNSLAELEEIVRDCKKKPHNFALLKAKEGVVLKASPLKSCEVMFRAAKDAGGIPAISMTGTMIATGKTLEMTIPTEEFPASLPKLAKKHFMSMKLPLKVVVILPNGQRIEDSDDGELEAQEGTEVEVAEQVSDAAQTQDDPDAARKEKLAARIKAIVPGLRDAVARALPGVDKLSKAVQTAATEMANASLERAEKLLDAAEAGLRQLTGGGDGNATVDNEAGLREKLVQEFSGMAADLRTMLQGAEKAVAGKATGLIGMFKAEIERDLKKSGQILSLLRSMATSELAKRQQDSNEGNESEGEQSPQGENLSGPGQGEGLSGPENEGAGEGNMFKKIKQALSGKKSEEPTVVEGGGGVVEDVLSLADRIGKAVTDGAGKALELLKDNANLLAMAGEYPAAALAAKEALDAFDETLGGDIAITPELLAKASGDVTTAKGLLADAEKALEDANALKKGGKRNKAVKAAQKAIAEAKAALTKAQEYEKAAKGKKVVEDAMTTGPLSPDAPKKFSGGAALELIKGATRDPDLTATALEAARTGEHHEAVAGNLGKMIDLKAGGFAGGGKSYKEDYSAEYATKLMKMGGSAGPEYFARMGDYMASGRQFENNPTNELPATSFGELEQKRSMSVGRALYKDDGTIDLDSDKAKNAIGDALFNPTALKNPRPALSSHMLKTVDFLKDPTNAGKAGTILKNVPEPTDPNAKGLVQRATGKGPTDAVGKGDVRDSVMASMLKPLDQGPVGSCFSTAPTRRMRETDPLGAMGAYAQIAGTGKYKPPFGPEVPAVSNTPPGDDPIMRSWEYSLASSTAQRGASSTKASLGSANNAGLATLSGAISTKNLAGNSGLPPEEQKKKKEEEDKKAALRLSKLKGDVAAAFSFVYDPLDEVKDANDGSSTSGRYILKRINPEKEVRKKEDFIEVMTEIALASLGIDKNAPEAVTMVDHVKSDAFINAVTQVFGTKKENEYLPWALGSGGQTTEATQALHGDTLAERQTTPKAGDPKPDEATRTKDVLKGFLTGMTGKTEDMITMRTTGMHGFNALPNHPSLDKLKGDTQTKRDQAMEDNLLKPGRALRDTKIPADKALEMFMKEMQPKVDNAKTEDLKTAYGDGITAHKPTAEMTPAELETAIKKATKTANAARGKADADAWKKGKTDKGETVTDEDYTKKLAEETAAWEKAVTGPLLSRMMADLGAPEFVLADTNWGSGADHTFFVVAPDPTTGEPALWQKTVPPGTLTKATRDWIDAEWAKID